MPRKIVIDFDVGREDFVRVWQFGEALYHACREDGWAVIALDEVDRATNQLKVSVFSKRRVRRIEKLIHQLLEKHFLGDRARVSLIMTPD